MVKGKTFKAEQKKKSRWEVIVGNVGTVYDGENGYDAQREYGEYKRISKEPFGRASGENVVLMRDGEIYWEHQGSNPTT